MDSSVSVYMYSNNTQVDCETLWNECDIRVGSFVGASYELAPTKSTYYTIL